jgi:hypothetical protein
MPLPLEDRKRLELHSLDRYPPISVDDEAADALEREGLVVFMGRTTPGGTRRFRLTEKGHQRQRETADLCKLDHCPCKNPDTMGAAQVESLRDSILAKFLRERG